MPVLGLKELTAALHKVSAEADLAARATVLDAAKLLETAAKHNFGGAHKKGEPHVPAFQNGHPIPNVVTGTLRRSIRHDPLTRYGLGEWGTRVGPSTAYSRRVELEYGYAFFTPAAEGIASKLPEIGAAHWRKFLKL
ncbi:MAG TPA: hypothetical protein VGL39_27915 [Jatrophihabitantaceae bacterium]|jgi:hypothetical protein